VNVKTLASSIADRFSQVDPASSALYKANLAKFSAALDAKYAEWQKTLESYRGAKIVTYHRDFVYLAARFHLEVVEELEPKPGIAPSPAHIAKVIQTMKAKGSRVILVQPYQNRRTAETVARQTGAVVLDMPQQPGARRDTPTYFATMDYLVNTLATALGAQR
jgi:zinc/manganese transport system substrate-binding protein